AFGVEPHAELLEVFGGDLAAEIQDAVGLAIAVVVAVASGLGQLFDHQLVRRLAGIAHAQIDNVLPFLPLLMQEGVDARQDVLREAVDPLGKLNAERLELLAGRSGAVSAGKWLRRVGHGCWTAWLLDK